MRVGIGQEMGREGAASCLPVEKVEWESERKGHWKGDVGKLPLSLWLFVACRLALCLADILLRLIPGGLHATVDPAGSIQEGLGVGIWVGDRLAGPAAAKRCLCCSERLGHTQPKPRSQRSTLCGAVSLCGRAGPF